LKKEEVVCFSRKKMAAGGAGGATLCKGEGAGVREGGWIGTDEESVGSPSPASKGLTW
jgi:hypothetical protein